MDYRDRDYRDAGGRTARDSREYRPANGGRDYRDEYARGGDEYTQNRPRSRAGARPDYRRRSGPSSPYTPFIVGAVLFVACVVALVMSMVPRNAKAPADDTGAGTETGDSANDTTPPNTTPDLSGLPEALRALYDKVPAARDYVLEWFNRPKPVEASQIDLSSLDTSRVPELYQWDLRWGYSTYSGNYLGLSGCGPTALSMVAIYFTKDTSLNPQKVAEFAQKNGYAEAGDGTAWTLFSEGSKSLGLSVRELQLSQAQIDQALAGGDLVTAIMGPGDFTTSGHYIVLTGGDGTGGYTIHDPNNPDNTSRLWTYAQLESQIRNIWAFNKA